MDRLVVPLALLKMVLILNDVLVVEGWSVRFPDSPVAKYLPISDSVVAKGVTPLAGIVAICVKRCADWVESRSCISDNNVPPSEPLYLAKPILTVALLPVPGVNVVTRSVAACLAMTIRLIVVVKAEATKLPAVKLP